jgi:hypothetical protein
VEACDGLHLFFQVGNALSMAAAVSFISRCLWLDEDKRVLFILSRRWFYNRKQREKGDGFATLKCFREHRLGVVFVPPFTFCQPCEPSHSMAQVIRLFPVA